MSGESLPVQLNQILNRRPDLPHGLMYDVVASRTTTLRDEPAGVREFRHQLLQLPSEYTHVTSTSSVDCENSTDMEQH